MGVNPVTLELQWVRDQLRSLQHARLHGQLFTDEDRERYRVLCDQEQALLRAARDQEGSRNT